MTREDRSVLYASESLPQTLSKSSLLDIIYSIVVVCDKHRDNPGQLYDGVLDEVPTDLIEYSKIVYPR